VKEIKQIPQTPHFYLPKTGRILFSDVKGMTHGTRDPFWLEGDRVPRGW